MTNYRNNPDPQRQLAEAMAGKSTSPQAVADVPASTPTSLTFRVPWPPQLLRPNGGRSNPRAVHHVGKRYKATCCESIVVTLHEAGGNPPLWQRAVVDAVAYLPKRGQQQDDDNFWSSLKQARDALEACGVVANDSGLRIGTLAWDRDWDEPRIELTVKPNTVGTTL